MVKKYISKKLKEPGVWRYASNMGWMFFARLCSMVISFIATMYIARSLGPSNYGQLSYAVSYSGIFAILAAFGLDQLTPREMVFHEERRYEYLDTAFALKLILGFLGALSSVVFAWIFSDHDISLLLIAILSFTFMLSSLQLFSVPFQIDVNQKPLSIYGIFVTLVLNVLKIIAIASHCGVIYLALILLLDPILTGAGSLIFYLRRYRQKFRLRLDPAIAKYYLIHGAPFMFASAFGIISMRIDQVMIKHYLDASSVGVYDAAVRLSEIWFFIPNIITSAMIPAVMHAKRTSEELYIARSKKLLLLMVGATAIIAIPVTALAPWLVSIVYGVGFMGAVPILMLYIWSNIGNAITQITQQYLIIERDTRAVLFSSVMGAAFNVALNVILIPMMGIVGAAISSVVSYFIPTFALFGLTRSRQLMFRLILRMENLK